MTSPRVTLIRGAELVASPWKNGGGVTRQIAFEPGSGKHDFAWRISVADVAQAGPFSRFEGVDRTLVLLEGAGMLLDEGSVTHSLMHPLDLARFAGEASIDARLVDGPTRDFNLMVHREEARGMLSVWRAGETHHVDAHTVLLYCAQGSQQVRIGLDDVENLEDGDTLRIDATSGVKIETRGSGALLAIELNMKSQ
jgi:uncharacterized protein